MKTGYSDFIAFSKKALRLSMLIEESRMGLTDEMRKEAYELLEGKEKFFFYGVGEFRIFFDISKGYNPNTQTREDGMLAILYYNRPRMLRKDRGKDSPTYSLNMINYTFYDSDSK